MTATIMTVEDENEPKDISRHSGQDILAVKTLVKKSGFGLLFTAYVQQKIA
jgi:hypothetical protein